MNPLPPLVIDIRLCVQNALSKWQRCRPTIKYAFLRFCVHSLPTQMRLHDSSSAVCPICGDTFADISHVVSCRDLLQVASHSAAKHMFDGGPKFVSGLRDQLCSGPYMINDTPCDRPVTFSLHVLHTLGIFACDVREFTFKLTTLYVMQYCFTSLRRSFPTDSVSSQRSESLVAAANAAIY